MATSGKTTLQLGWTNPLTGVFGAHPVLGGPLDLNDGQTYTLASPDGLELSPPRKTVVPTGNIRSQGERVTRQTYRENREAAVHLILGPSNSYGQHIATIRALVAWLDASLTYPITIKWQPPSATNPIYLDVVASAHNVPVDESSWARLQVEGVECAFYVRPALRGDRIWLQNLALNPGFGAPSGPGVVVFNDPLANGNAYSGAGASVASNILTVTAGNAVLFGSPSWSAINAWTLRVQFVTGLSASFYLHYTNASNFLRCVVTGTALSLIHTIAGVSTTLATTAIAPVNTTFYWLTLTQYPTVAGNPPLVQATLYADSAGAKGAQMATIGPAATADAVTALSGRCQVGATGASLAIGGAFANVMTVSLFGPGAWLFTPNLSTATGAASGGWEQTLANTYPGGPTTSWGAGRVDLPPAGTVDCGWRLYTGGALAGVIAAMPVANAGDTLQSAVWAKSSGLSANALLRLYLTEYDVNGAQLRQTLVATLGGNQAAWVQISGSLATGASCAYADLMLRVVDTIAPGESANATVWFDNVQVWDQTQTGAVGAGSMPYCELRFPQSPAQLTISGLLGDLPAPALVAIGTYIASLATGSALMWALGRRGQASANGLLVGVPQGFQTANTGSQVPATSAVLDAASYGGYYLATTLGNGFNPRGFNFSAADMLGVYHLYSRAWTAEAGANLANVQTRMVTQQRSQAWFGAANGSDQLASYNGPWTAPMAAASTWTVADSGQANVPAFPAGALVDPNQNYLTPRSQWQDTTAGGGAFRAGWQCLVPVDGSLLLGLMNNPSNNTFALSGWVWQYVDGLLTSRGGPGDSPALTYSMEVGPQQAVARSAGGPGTQSTGAPNVNLGADPYLTLDPQQAAVSAANTFAGTLGVNQLAGFMTDSAGDVLPLACDLIYTPLYHYPR